MADYSFLPHFITEDIYLIKEEVAAPTETPTPAVEPVTKEEPVAPVATTESSPQQASLLPEENVVKEPEPVYLKPLPTEGNNLKHCLVLVESDTDILEPALKGLLEKIMGAVKRSMDDILLANVKAASVEQIEALLSEQNHRHLLAFGTDKVVQLSEVGPYELTLLSGKRYLRAHSLTAISEDIEHKKKLWAALKEMF